MFPWVVLVPLDLLAFLLLGKLFFGDVAGFLDALQPDEYGFALDQYRVLLYLIIVAVVVYGELKAFGGI
jgi:hypothetical protein